ncbi:hypothetical protein CAPTEDRAFT_202589 [Capitella teleta]|uniref:Ig-like domain-containing protein n=1 Tax=Capitella teleta TaxID=283909 RepID=R7V2T1_CAPTE|nr:hypothetical protein CAPTEDRAFT_202589 [Capitella teleta]|eukprot:ELU13148.1 hypothetical protein CAPTEDRAFT_202589 [Capitella teleta]
MTGIRILSITASDAQDKYIINLATVGLDDDAAIHIYRTPDDAVLTSSPDDVKEGDDIWHKCSCSSNSLPLASRPNVLMLYTWFRDSVELDPDALPIRHSFNESDHSMLLIYDINRADTGSYKCIGYENGSRLQSEESDTYVLDVLSNASDAAIITGNSEAAENENITLTCFTSELGNPEGNYTWITPNGDTHLGDTLAVISLSIEEDEGEYECYVENHKRGASDEHTLTVNSKSNPAVTILSILFSQSSPTIEQKLKTVANTDETFLVSCMFRSKPVAIVRWLKDGSVVPSQIFQTKSWTEEHGKFTLTLSELSWSGSDVDARRGQGGDIMCETDNGIFEPVLSITMDLTITYGPEILSFTISPPDGSIFENDDANFSCSVDTRPGANIQLLGPEGFSKSVENETGLWHTLYNVTGLDSGTYTCSSNNSMTGKVDDITLNVQVQCK